MLFFFLISRRPPRFTRTDTLFPYTTLCRSSRLVGAGRQTGSRPSPRSIVADFYRLSPAAGKVPRHDAHTVVSGNPKARSRRSEEHTSELQSLMRISYAVFCLKKKNNTNKLTINDT